MKQKFLIVLLIILLFLSSIYLSQAGTFSSLKGYKSTMNFCVWAPTQDDADRVAKSLEDYYKRFLSDLKYGGMLKKKPEIYVFKNYEEYVEKGSEIGHELSNSGGIAVPHSAREAAKVYSFLSYNLTDRVLPHELTHLIFREITAGLKTNAVVPLWINEGMATYEEGPKDYRKIVLSALDRGEIILISDIVSFSKYPEGQNKNLLFYAESASLVDFLINKYGGDKFLSFSKKIISGGKDINEALYSAYYPHIKNVSGLSDAWLKFQRAN